MCAGLKHQIASSGDDKHEKAKLVAQLTGIECAHAAHNNGIEFFTFFGIAGVVALAAGVDRALIASATTLAVAARAAYTAIYLLPASEALGLMRSTAFAAGLSAVFALLWAASAADNGLVARFF